MLEGRPSWFERQRKVPQLAVEKGFQLGPRQGQERCLIAAGRAAEFGDNDSLLFLEEGYRPRGVLIDRYGMIRDYRAVSWSRKAPASVNGKPQVAPTQT